MLLGRNARQLGRLGDDDVFLAEPEDAFDVAPVEPAKALRTIPTFSADIARAVSRGAGPAQR
jgi:hypothetical protein